MTSNLVVAGSSPAGGAATDAKRKRTVSHDMVSKNGKDAGETGKGRPMSHERTIILYTAFMIALVVASAVIIAWVA